MTNPYPQYSNGLFGMTISDLNDFAIKIMEDKAPELLSATIPDIRFLAEEGYYMRIIENVPMVKSAIVGAVIFDAVDPEYKWPISTGGHIHVQTGDILVSDRLCTNSYRTRFTIAHELAHWILHRAYNEKIKKNYDMRRCGYSVVLHVTDRREHGKKNPIQSRSDDDLAEWQADHLAAALLMPAISFSKMAKEQIEIYGDSRDSRGIIIKNMASAFDVSKRSAYLRLRSLGYLMPWYLAPR